VKPQYYIPTNTNPAVTTQAKKRGT